MDRGSDRGVFRDEFDFESPRVGQNSDAEDGSTALSDYSSCDGSDFERYCSANSILGTASVCSSVGNRSDLLDAFRSLGLGDDLGIDGARERNRRKSFSGRRNLTDSGRFDSLSDGTVESPRENGSYQNGAFGERSAALPRSRTVSKSGERSMVDAKTEGSMSLVTHPARSYSFRDDSEAFSGLDPSYGSSVHDKKVVNTENSGFCFQGSACEHHAQNGSVGADDAGAAIHGCSDGEDSMLDSGTDEEDRIHMIQRQTLQHFKDTKIKNSNPLLMGSAIAFGDDDWDEFMQETGGVGPTSVSLFGSKTSASTQISSDKSEVILEPASHEHDDTFISQEAKQLDDVGDVSSPSFQLPMYKYSEESKSYPAACSLVLEVEDETVQQALSVLNTTSDLGAANPSENHLEIYANENELHLVSGKETDGIHFRNTEDRLLPDEPKLPLIAHDNSSLNVILNEALEVDETEPSEEHDNATLSPVLDNHHGFTEPSNKNIPDEVDGTGTNDFFDEMVLEMEEILLDSGESHQARYRQPNHVYMSQHSHHFRDGSSTASTSGINDVYTLSQCPPRIEWVEVVGAKQKKGDVSFGERLVGVKEYTVYRLRIWSGNDHWEVERRYRDFYSLYRQLKTLFKSHGLILPSPWSKVERESRSFFGNVSPHVVNGRSSLIQDCLRSILNVKTPPGTSSSLIWFLSPSKGNNSSVSNNLVPQSCQRLEDDVTSSSSHCGESCTEEIFTLGKTISLVVELKSYKSMRQLLEEQRYTCAGCHKHLDAGLTLMQEFVKTLGWGKPRLCEYTGQLFCSLCHTSDTAVLPAKVLHHWDFTFYPVSQLAKAYLESIYEQPMLCVSAVNPFLFSKVPALHHIMGIRKKIGSMLPYVQCPFRRSIQRGLGSRRYLLESNDFFALKDLVDLSKGPFAGLPVMVENISNKILEHITQHCLVCYEIGVPCAARKACKDPSSVILPFQESEANRCNLCSSIFHEPCFRQLGGCPCQRPIAAATLGSTVASERPSFSGEAIEVDGMLALPTQKSHGKAPSTGFFSDLLSKARPEKLWKQKDDSHVIPMGSLPNTSS